MPPATAAEAASNASSAVSRRTMRTLPESRDGLYDVEFLEHDPDGSTTPARFASRDPLR
jgi:hypothetical protein